MKLRLKFLNFNFSIYALNKNINSTFKLNVINLDLKKLITFLEGKSKSLSKALLNFKSPIICFGNAFLKHGFNLINTIIFLKKLIPTIKVVNISLACNSEGANTFHIQSVTNRQIQKSNQIFCINLSDTITLAKLTPKAIKNVTWFNTHGSKLALNAYRIIPILSSFEEEQIFLNLEQRPQKTLKIFSNVSKAKSFIQFIKILTLPNKLINLPPLLIELIKDKHKFKTLGFKLFNCQIGNSKQVIPIQRINVQTVIKTLENFYLTNNSTKNSKTMLNSTLKLALSTHNFNCKKTTVT